MKSSIRSPLTIKPSSDAPELPDTAYPHAKKEIPDWNDFRLLSSVFRTRSLTKTARMLGLSQATVSRQMDRLERNVGLKLLERTTSGAALTPEGMRLLDDLKEAWEIFERAINRLRRERDTVRLLATEGLATKWIPRFLKYLADTDIELRLSSANDEVLDIQETFDLAILYRPPDVSNMVASRLGTLHLIPYASADYLDRFGHPADAADLAKHTLLDNSSFVIDKGAWKLRLPDTSDDIRISLLVNSTAVLLESIRNGVGIGWLPTYVSMFERNLVPLELDLRLSTPIYLCRYREAEENSALQSVHHFLKHILDRRKMPWLRDEFVPPTEFPPATVEEIMESYLSLGTGL